MEDNTQNSAASNAAAPQSKNKAMLYTTIAIVLIAALGAGYFLLSNNTPSGLGTDTEQPDGTGSGPVAVVNGEEIDRETYDRAYTQYQSILGQAGMSEDQIRQQTITDLVNSVLIKQAALEAGYSASDADIQAEIAAITESNGGAEAFAAQLEQAGVTDAEVETQVGEQLAINAYVQEAAGVADITVTDEEIQEAYDQAASANESLPALEDVRDQIEQQLRSQKQQELVAQLVAELRADAEIEILL